REGDVDGSTELGGTNEAECAVAHIGEGEQLVLSAHSCGELEHLDFADGMLGSLGLCEASIGLDFDTYLQPIAAPALHVHGLEVVALTLFKKHNRRALRCINPIVTAISKGSCNHAKIGRAGGVA